jgi:UDP-GlcNAc:undecaprenyl-phosphate GlcNAc-1-phosphate transferase
VHNFPPARVFMGDTGSIPLGFLAGALGGYGWAAGAWPAWFPVLVFSPFVVDATVTLLRRLARRERVWIAHRTHYYQRLVLCGWSPRRLAWSAYALMAVAAAAALAAREPDGQGHYAIIAASTLAYFFILLAIDRRAPFGRRS